MQETLLPENQDQFAELARFCLSEKKSLAISGNNSKSGFGYSVQADIDASMSACTGIIEYDPAELVMRARAGTTLNEIKTVLTEQQQQLAFEPETMSALYSNSREDTIAGVFASNLSGSRRFQAGSARDHLLGFNAINGRAELYKSGGNVIKNVTGYDLSKLICGSWGTLSVLTELSFKVLPAPAVIVTAILDDLNTEKALGLLSTLATSPLHASGLALLPGGIKSALESNVTQANCTSLIRFEGSRTSVDARLREFQTSYASQMSVSLLEQDESLQIWKALSSASPVAYHPVIMKLSIPPSLALRMSQLLNEIGNCNWYLDAAGAWFWLGLETTKAVENINRFRSSLAEENGSAILYKAPDEIKNKVGIYSPAQVTLESLRLRIKESFDPANIFNPGRLDYQK
ncbi:MAG: FAD-binding protein [Gammaproteobacteria bacterium]|nr:FAD-binding protein [Gammaproteobacteria bacterium]